MTTVSRLRHVLSDYFEPPAVDTALRVARLAGTIPEGQSGYGGCRSAPVSIKQSLLVLLALASDAHPKHGPAEAERIAGFKLLRRDRTHSGEPEQRTPYENQHVTLLAAMVSEVERFDPPDRLPSSWDVTAGGVCQVSPDRLLFGDSLADVLDPSDDVIRSTIIPCRLLCDIAELFRARAANVAAIDVNASDINAPDDSRATNAAVEAA